MLDEAFPQSTNLIIAVVDGATPEVADEAADALIAWYEENSIPMDAIGVLSEDDRGKIKTHLVGARKTAGGAILLGVAALLTGGMAIGLGVIGGSIVGAGAMLFLPELTSRREQLSEETKKHMEILEGQVRDLGDQLKKMNPPKAGDDQSKQPAATPSPSAK